MYNGLRGRSSQSPKLRALAELHVRHPVHVDTSVVDAGHRAGLSSAQGLSLPGEEHYELGLRGIQGCRE